MAAEAPIPDNLHVVVRYGRNHYSPVGVADRRPPWGVLSNKEKAKVEVEA
jgi:hypothetical protein